MPTKLVLVNSKDEVIGESDKLEAHKKGLLHRAFSVFVLRKNEATSKIELLLQQRQKDKYHSAGLWTNTCCSHPYPNEEISKAAQRRLKEEMGLNTALKFLDKFCYHADFGNGMIEHEWDYVFFGFSENEEVHFNPSEVQAFRWETLENIEKELKATPELYTAWFEKAFSYVVRNLG